MKFTPWFPEGVQPVHVGVYEVAPDWDGTRYYCFWSGRWWGWATRHMEEADLPFYACKCVDKWHCWRGLVA